jgi:hypothetical protein
MSAIWESANWTRQTGNRQFGMLPVLLMKDVYLPVTFICFGFFSSNIWLKITSNKKSVPVIYILYAQIRVHLIFFVIFLIYVIKGVGVSEWLLFNANSAIFQLYHGKNKLIFNVGDDDEIRFVLDQHAELDFYSASSLKQQSSNRHVAILGHIILIPSQTVFALSS